MASRKGVILLSCIFVGFILLLLYRETFVHLSIIYRREKYSAGSSVRNVIEPKDLGMQSDCDDACNWMIRRIFMIEAVAVLPFL